MLKYEERSIIRTGIEIDSDMLTGHDLIRSILAGDVARLGTLDGITDEKIAEYTIKKSTNEKNQYCQITFEKELRILTSLIGIADKVMALKLKQMKEVISYSDEKTNSGEELAESIYGNAAERRRLVQEYNRRILELAGNRRAESSPKQGD